MASTAQKIWETATELSRAWEALADHDMPGFDYRGHLKKLRNFDSAKTREQYEHQWRLLADKEQKLRSQMLWRIESGEFDAYGRDITYSMGANIVKLPNSLFYELAKDFEVEWDANKVIVRNRVVIDIRIVPHFEETEEISESTQLTETTKPINPTKHKKVPTSSRAEGKVDINASSVVGIDEGDSDKSERLVERTIKMSIRACYEANPKIVNLIYKVQIEHFRDWIRANCRNIDVTSRGYSDKNFEKYIRKIKPGFENVG